MQPSEILFTDKYDKERIFEMESRSPNKTPNKEKENRLRSNECLSPRSDSSPKRLKVDFTQADRSPKNSGGSPSPELRDLRRMHNFPPDQQISSMMHSEEQEAYKSMQADQLAERKRDETLGIKKPEEIYTDRLNRRIEEYNRNKQESLSYDDLTREYSYTEKEIMDYKKEKFIVLYDLDQYGTNEDLKTIASKAINLLDEELTRRDQVDAELAEPRNAFREYKKLLAKKYQEQIEIHNEHLGESPSSEEEQKILKTYKERLDVRSKEEAFAIFNKSMAECIGRELEMIEMFKLVDRIRLEHEKVNKFNTEFIERLQNSNIYPKDKQTGDDLESILVQLEKMRKNKVKETISNTAT